MYWINKQYIIPKMKWGVLVVVALLAVAACARLMDIEEVDKIMFGKGANNMVQRNTEISVDNIVCMPTNRDSATSLSEMLWKCDAMNSTNIVTRVYHLSCFEMTGMFIYIIDIDRCTLEFDMARGATKLTMDRHKPIYAEINTLNSLLSDLYFHGVTSDWMKNMWFFTVYMMDMIFLIIVITILITLLIIFIFGGCLRLWIIDDKNKQSASTTMSVSNDVDKSASNCNMNRSCCCYERCAECSTSNDERLRIRTRHHRIHSKERDRARKLEESRRMYASDL